MIQDKDLNFLCSKMEQLRTATFTNFSTAFLKFPVCVIQLSAADNDGNLWFAVRKPYQCIEDFERSFPAQLHFYNKDYNYRIAAHGKATIVAEEQTVNTTICFSKVKKEEYAIIKFEVLSAEYNYNKQSNRHYLKDFIDDMINKVLFSGGPLQFRF